MKPTIDTDNTAQPLPVDYDPFAGDSLVRAVPTTEAQREVWLADQLGRDASLAYNESASLTLHGALDVAALQQALQALAQRHEALRATLSGDGMQLLIAGQATLQAQLVDLSAGADDEQRATLEELRTAAVETPFDLLRGPLFRATLARLGDERAELILTGHHIIYDGWSCGVVATELMQLYAAYAAGAPATLAPADSFAAYAVAARGGARAAATEADGRYWLALYDAGIPVLELPTDRPRPARRGFASRREDLPLDAALVEGLRQFGARQGASLFATLFGLFGALLARLSGSAEVVLGVPAAGQAAAGQPALVGHCVNLLPVRLAVDAEAPVGALIGAARGRVLDAYEHQASTLGEILKLLQVPREPGRLPLAQVLFNVDAAIDAAALSQAGLRVGLRANPRRFDNFELFLNASQVDGAIVLELQYNTDLFDQATARRWLALYRAALRRVVAEPARSIAAAFAPDDAELAMLAGFNDSAADFPRAARIESLIAEQAAATPQASAVSAGDARLRYRELERRANGVAALLREQGVADGGLVGLCCARNEHLLVGLLGILKAGAGYVPLDPAFPQERLEYMAADAGLAVVLADRGAAACWRFGAARRIDIEDASPAEAAPAHRADADGVAYVIYTSGSTGKPKGVQVPHRAVVNFLTSMRRTPGIEAADRLLAVTTLSFDIAVLELLLPLCVGAEVVLADREQAGDPYALAQLLQRSGANIMQATPGTWRMLLDSGWRGGPGFKALVGGEALAPELAARLLAATGQLWNMYGPTETTVWSSCWRVAPQAPAISIGRPIANTTIRVLDEQRRPCPIGVAGELWIGGAGVALGYLNRPELTAERFIDDPFASAPGARLYRTGDRGRWRADGLLEHLGRNDFQVKVRGYRIELGEIEAALDTHPGVLHSVVLAREDVPGDVRLVAYVVAPTPTPADGRAADGAPGASALRAHLRTTLPDYMLPQHVVTLERLPLLPNGKIDRKALPPPASASAAAADGAGHAPPRTALESQILAIMEQVLNLPRLGVRDNFFAVGGHSLLASQLAARVGAALGAQLPLRAVFEAPSAERLAQWVEAAGRGGADAPWVIARRAERSTAPLSPMQERLWYLEQMDPGRPTYNTPSAHRLRGKLDETAFTLAFADMVARQDVLRTAVAVVDGAPVQVITPAQEAARLPDLLPLEDLRGVAAEAREEALRERLAALAAEPIELTEAPLFRARLFRTGDEEYVFYFGPHHIIWDGWCFDILYTEMAALYQARRTGTDCTLAAPALAYGDFAAWQRDWLKSADLATQLAHWRARLGGTLEPLAIPTDRPRPAELSGRGATCWISIERARVEAARALAGQHDATLFTALLATYVLSLHQLTGQTALTVGVPMRGRQIDALENLMGMFVNVLPLRLSIDPQWSFTRLLAEVRDGVTEAFKYPDVPFEQLVRALEVPRDASRFPLYQALFSFQDARGRAHRWGNLEHAMVDLLQPGLEQDLALWLLDRPGGLVGGLSYSTDLLEAASAELLSRRYEHLLGAVLAQPDTPLAQLPLAAHELRQLAEFNATERPYARDATIEDLILAQVRATPRRTAVSYGDAKLSYEELDQRANRLANLLRARGVGRGQLVGLCVERGTDMVVAKLAVLKSGAAYVPFDPAYPAERLRFMADDAGLVVMVTEAALADVLAWPREHSVLLDADADAIAAAPATRPPQDALAADADSVAYVIYTSGSTGKPKGVQVLQRGVVNFLTSMRDTPGMNADDRLLAVTTLSFDIATLDLLLPLCVGAEIVLASREQALDGIELAQVLERSGASVMQATPGTWRMLLDSGWRGGPGFKAMIGGEALAPDLAARLLAVSGQLWNMYGPTETTVWSSCWLVTPDAPAISVGRPIANTVIRVLDAQHRLCPIGVAGELWIGGDGVALGYLNRPELTAERFIPDPFASAPGARLYCTGDRGRWRADGLLEHLGRNDFQVKVRGYRIELGEVEAALERHPGVAHSVAVAREDVPGDVRLVAYAVARVPAPGADGVPEAPDATALRAHLRAIMPAYMLPQHVVILERLPLLPNGKIDRKALPRPDTAPTPAPTAGQPGEELQTDTERLLASIWTDLLGISGLGPNDNFFDAGGHSLLAMQAILAMETHSGKRLNPRRFIFENLRQLARAYDEPSPEAAKPGILNRLFSGLLGKGAR